MEYNDKEVRERIIKQGIKDGWNFIGRIIYSDKRFAHFHAIESEDYIFTRIAKNGNYHWCVGGTMVGNVTEFDKPISVIDFIKIQMLDRNYGMAASGRYVVRSMKDIKAKLEGMDNWIEFDEKCEYNLL